MFGGSNSGSWARLVSADGDQDDDADGHDFLIWQRNFAPAPPPTTGSGDVNSNGVTDINDYMIIRNNFLGTGQDLHDGRPERGRGGEFH